jgi:hypothetical protein
MIGIVVACGLGLIVLAVTNPFHLQPLWTELERGFGEALFIAGFIAAIVDKYVKARMLREISNDVAHYLIGYQLPVEMQGKIKELMECRLIRRNWHANYIANRSIEPGMLEIEVTISWDVVNISDTEAPYEQYLALEEHDRPQIFFLECDSTDSRSKYRVEGSKAKVKDGVLEIFGKKIKIRPNSSAGGIKYRCSARYQIVLPDQYSDMFSFAAPTVNLTLHARFPDELDFIAPPADVQTTGQWEFNRLFMPGEHVRVRWLHKAASTAAAAR